MMDLDEAKIVWLGNSSKPAEITLPKHLVAVTVVDAPFVYAIPVTELERCHELGPLAVEDIDVVRPVLWEWEISQMVYYLSFNFNPNLN